jgi:glycosyltransferase involved in cell wall biosynthesis
LQRNQIVASYQQADLFLFPSNIECSPIVLFEAIASKTPFLVTNVGNSKEIIEWTKGGELLPTNIDENGLSHADIPRSAKLLSNVLKDPNKIIKMKENGYANWLERFTWEKIAEQYEQLYAQLISESH